MTDLRKQADMRTVPLGGKKAAGRVALVDDCDYELVMQHQWAVFEQVRAGRKHGPYALTNIRRPDGFKTTLRMHKLITGYEQTDHIDHDGLNNQRYNLRPATTSQNMHNRRPNIRGTSRFKGVYKRDNEWHGAIQLNGRRHHLGRFASEKEAARAYNAAAREMYGAYAYLNDVD